MGFLAVLWKKLLFKKLPEFQIKIFPPNFQIENFPENPGQPKSPSKVHYNNPVFSTAATKEKVCVKFSNF
jgi:hypothetical protein